LIRPQLTRLTGSSSRCLGVEETDTGVHCGALALSTVLAVVVWLLLRDVDEVVDRVSVEGLGAAVRAIGSELPASFGLVAGVRVLPTLVCWGLI
jgi:hypothetical protein